MPATHRQTIPSSGKPRRSALAASLGAPVARNPAEIDRVRDMVALQLAELSWRHCISMRSPTGQRILSRIERSSGVVHKKGHNQLWPCLTASSGVDSIAVRATYQEISARWPRIARTMDAYSSRGLNFDVTLDNCKTLLVAFSIAGEVSSLRFGSSRTSLACLLASCCSILVPFWGFMGRRVKSAYLPCWHPSRRAAE